MINENNANECRLMGFIKDKLPLQKNKKGFYFVEFFLRFLQPGSHKKKIFQTIRCICQGPQAIYFADKFHSGEKVNIVGELKSQCRCFEEGFYYETIVSVKKCYQACVNPSASLASLGEGFLG